MTLSTSMERLSDVILLMIQKLPFAKFKESVKMNDPSKELASAFPTNVVSNPVQFELEINSKIVRESSELEAKN